MRVLPSSFAARLRLSLLLAVLAGVGYYSNAYVLYSWLRYSPREGDIVFQSLPRCELVDAIEGTTHSPFSHCGVVLKEQSGWVVIEAIGEVRETPLLRWMQRGRHAGVAIFRIDPRYTSRIPEFRKELLPFLGRPYNYDFDMSQASIYCSELPYLAFLKATGEQLGTLEKLGDLDWKPFEAFIRTWQADSSLPLDRVMITPASLAKAKQLIPVYRCGL